MFVLFERRGVREFWRDFRRGGAKKGRGERKKKKREGGEDGVARRGPSLRGQFENCIRVRRTRWTTFFFFFSLFLPLRRTYDFDALTDPDTRCLFRRPNEKFPRFTPVWSEIKPKPTADYSLSVSSSRLPFPLCRRKNQFKKSRTKKNFSMEKNLAFFVDR